jgi:hypothetical protein
MPVSARKVRRENEVDLLEMPVMIKLRDLMSLHLSDSSESPPMLDFSTAMAFAKTTRFVPRSLESLG